MENANETMKLFKRHRPWVTLQNEEQFIPENYSETGVESGEAAERILCALGFYPVQPIVVKTRKILKNGNICACLDDVQGLGTFLELEIMAESEEARPAALERIEEILQSIGHTMADTTRASYLSQLQKQAEGLIV